ncbi:MAG: NUDIX domain-containing protein [Desulfobacteraceae bacterium]|nr:MAG: NUDIX domain-containing protein [Desulfobacteraceae bacterium]
MPKTSAGLLMYRFRNGQLEVFLVHPGGPFWRKKDHGAWSIPKGEYAEGEDPFEVARREFTEETGFAAEGDFITLTPLRQPSRKIISAWAFEGDCDPAGIKSNLFTIEWPPGSGKQVQFPEVDRAEWFSLPTAIVKLHKGQVGFVEQLYRILRPDQWPS